MQLILLEERQRAAITEDVGDDLGVVPVVEAEQRVERARDASGVVRKQRRFIEEVDTTHRGQRLVLADDDPKPLDAGVAHVEMKLTAFVERRNALVFEMHLKRGKVRRCRPGRIKMCAPRRHRVGDWSASVRYQQFDPARADAKPVTPRGEPADPVFTGRFGTKQIDPAPRRGCPHPAPQAESGRSC